MYSLWDKIGVQQWQISQYLLDCYAKQARNHSSREEVQLLLDFMNRSVVSVIKSMFLLKTTLLRHTEDQNHILRLTCEKLHFYANLSHNISLEAPDEGIEIFWWILFDVSSNGTYQRKRTIYISFEK